MDPAWLAGDGGRALLAVVRGARVRDPRHFRRDGRAVREGVEDAVADVGGAADAVEEFGLEEARDAQGGGGEGDTEGGVGADEEVLERMCQLASGESE